MKSEDVVSLGTCEAKTCVGAYMCVSALAPKNAPVEVLVMLLAPCAGVFGCNLAYRVDAVLIFQRLW